MKKIAVSLLLVVFIFSSAYTVAAYTRSAVKRSSASKSDVVDIGNPFCPISADQVSGKYFVEHDGKRYGLCSKMCIRYFKKNPAKYIEKLKIIGSRMATA